MIEITDCDLELNSTEEILKDRGLEDGGRIQKYIDSEVLRLCAPYVPLETGALNRSGINNTKIGSGLVIYKTPYARRWYYMPANFNGAPVRGNYWFEKMKKNGGKASILKGVKERTGGR